MCCRVATGGMTNRCFGGASPHETQAVRKSRHPQFRAARSRAIARRRIRAGRLQFCVLRLHRPPAAIAGCVGLKPGHGHAGEAGRRLDLSFYVHRRNGMRARRVGGFDRKGYSSGRPPGNPEVLVKPPCQCLPASATGRCRHTSRAALVPTIPWSAGPACDLERANRWSLLVFVCLIVGDMGRGQGAVDGPRIMPYRLKTCPMINHSIYRFLKKPLLFPVETPGRSRRNNCSLRSLEFLCALGARFFSPRSATTR